jgi:signal-transduction protein with cAMP-binding, CBS, and nucleotidyltransferase domain
MYFICRGEVEVIDATGKTMELLREGDFFGEIGILMTRSLSDLAV